MSESRQRWRIAFSRGEEAQFLSHLDAVKLWERAFRRGDIPIATTEGFNPRPRLIFAAPLPLGTLAEHELADLFLSERLTLHDTRTRLERGMPRGYRLVELHDEWVGAPALATQLVAADYRMTVLGADARGLDAGIAGLMAADRLDREKRRESKSMAYNLRPLLIELRTLAPAPEAIRDLGREGPLAGLWMRLRHSQDLGSGRPEEVVAALAEAMDGGMDVAVNGGSRASQPGDRAGRLEPVLPIRERLWLGDELPD